MSGWRIVAFTAMVALTAACGASGPKRVRKPGDEYLVGIKIEGSDVSIEGLRTGLALNRNLKAGRAIDEYQLSVDTQRVIGAFQKKGFFSVQVTPKVETKLDGQKAVAQTLVFHIVEGPRAVAHVQIEGLPPDVKPEEARELIKLKDGAPFDYAAFDDAKTPLLALVENRGYAHAELLAEVLADRKTNSATLHYSIDAGPRVTFGPIEVVGVTGPLADAARERLSFKTGDGYSTKALAESQEAIYGTSLFATVRVDADRSAVTSVVPVRIQLAEATHSEARGGGGFGIDSLTYNFRLRGSLSHRGWPTPLTTTSIEGRPELTILRDNCLFTQLVQLECHDVEPRARVLGVISQQDFLRKDVKADLEGGYDYVTLEGFVQKGPRTRIGIGMPLWTPRLQGHIGWQFAYYSFSHISPAIDLAEQSRLGLSTHIDERLGTFSESIALDLRDNPIEPTKGAYAEVRLAEGTWIAGGAYNYLQAMPELRGYAPLGATVLAGHARFGGIFGDIPVTERYYAGGAASERGFADRRLSPEAMGTDSNGKPITVVVGGGALFETGLELRRHWEPWGIKAGYVVFLDGGDVTNTTSELDLTHLHWAVGAGLRFFYLPIGPIRLEIAQRLNRLDAPSANQPRNYILSVGEAF